MKFLENYIFITKYAFMSRIVNKKKKSATSQHI